MTPPNVALYVWIRRSFDFQGRSTRSEYWWPRLLVTIVNTGLGLLFLNGGGEAWFALMLDLSEQASESGIISAEDFAFPPLTSLGTFGLTASIVFAIFTFFPMLSVSWRRFQDLGRPGWIHLIVMFFMLLTYPYGQIVMFIEFVFFAFRGTKGENRYGPDPLEGIN